MSLNTCTGDEKSYKQSIKCMHTLDVIYQKSANHFETLILLQQGVNHPHHSP